MKRPYWIALYCLGWALPILTWLNYLMVSFWVLRFASGQLNLITFFGLQLLGPVLVLVAGWSIFTGWWKSLHTLIASAMVALAGLLIIVSVSQLRVITSHLQDKFTDPCYPTLCLANAEKLQHSDIVVYKTIVVTWHTSYNALRIRQEVSLLPGVKLVHNVAQYYPARTPTLRLVSPDVMQITYNNKSPQPEPVSRSGNISSVRLKVSSSWFFDRVEVQ